MVAEQEMRVVYASTLLKLAEKDSRIVLLDADLGRSSGTATFRGRFPGRAVNVGVAEANMVGVAAGLSVTGKIPFAETFGCFASRRAYDQFFISANYAGLSVKLVGTDPGITATLNGGTHMTFEDVGLMREIPGLTIVEPSDPVSLRKLLPLLAYQEGCAYLRLHRKPAPLLYEEDETFELGRGKQLREGGDIALIASGVLMVNEALQAAELLAQAGIQAAVIDMHTIKPIDAGLVVRMAERTGAVLTCENHQLSGGLGSAVAEVLAEAQPTLMKRIGVADSFGEVGDLKYLKHRYGLTAENIRRQAAALLKKRGSL
jgi:transketolase